MADKTATLKKTFVSVMEITDREEKPVARLSVHGTVELKFVGEPEVTYQAIRFGDMDLLPLLENLPNSDDAMQSIYNHVYRYIIDTFDMSTLERKDNEPGEIPDAVRDEVAPGPTDPATKTP